MRFLLAILFNQLIAATKRWLRKNMESPHGLCGLSVCIRDSTKCRCECVIRTMAPYFYSWWRIGVLVYRDFAELRLFNCKKHQAQNNSKTEYFTVWNILYCTHRRSIAVCGTRREGTYSICILHGLSGVLWLVTPTTVRPVFTNLKFCVFLRFDQKNEKLHSMSVTVKYNWMFMLIAVFKWLSSWNHCAADKNSGGSNATLCLTRPTPLYLIQLCSITTLDRFRFIFQLPRRELYHTSRK